MHVDVAAAGRFTDKTSDKRPETSQSLGIFFTTSFSGFRLNLSTGIVIQSDYHVNDKRETRYTPDKIIV